MYVMMKEVFEQGYCLYIITNQNRTLFNIGTTCDLKERLELWNIIPDKSMECVYLVYWEVLDSAEAAVAKEESLRRLSKRKKLALIERSNPGCLSLNEKISSQYLL